MICLQCAKEKKFFSSSFEIKLKFFQVLSDIELAQSMQEDGDNEKTEVNRIILLLIKEL